MTEPVLTFNSEYHPMLRRQFHWSENDGIHVALFAGKEMMICVNDDGAQSLGRFYR
jgi:hypothetical protein